MIIAFDPAADIILAAIMAVQVCRIYTGTGTHTPTWTPTRSANDPVPAVLKAAAAASNPVSAVDAHYIQVVRWSEDGNHEMLRAYDHISPEVKLALLDPALGVIWRNGRQERGKTSD